MKDFPHFEDGNRGLWVKSSVGMDTDVTSFRGGRLKLKCVADIFSVYSKAAEVQLEEEKPRSASVLGPKNSSKSSSMLNSSGTESFKLIPHSTRKIRAANVIPADV